MRIELTLGHGGVRPFDQATAQTERTKAHGAAPGIPREGVKGSPRECLPGVPKGAGRLHINRSSERVIDGCVLRA